MKKTNKFLACTSALFAMLLVACGQTGTSSKENKSSETPSSSVADSSAPGSSSVAPASSSQTPTSSTPASSSKTPASSSSKEVHVCHHTCPKCGGCQDETCKDPLCADKCTCEKDPEPTVVDVHWDANDQINLEAENGTVTGTMTGTDPGDQFIGERASDNPAHPTSGGKVVFCWAAQGNKVTWKINMPEAAQNAAFTLWATCAFSQQSSGLGFKVNGKSLKWDESTVNGQGNSGKWYYWNEIHTTGDLVKGENTLVIENLSGESWNLDNLIISKSSTPAHVCGHVCDICGKCTDPSCTDPRCAEKCQGHQALSFGESGRLRFEGENYTNMAKGEVSCNESAGASGGKIVEDFGYGDEINYEIILDKAYQNVHLEVMYGLGVNGSDNGAIELYVNDERVHGRGWTEATHPANDNIGMEVTGWACDTLGASNNFDLKAGKNVVQLCCPFGSFTNFDYFELVLESAPTPVDDTVKFDENDEILLEAEDGEITGTMTGTDPGDQFIGERASDNPAHPTSGGKVVFCWAAAGNKVTWKFKLEEAVDYAELTLWATCAFSQQASGLGITVNGEAKAWNEATVEGQGNQNKWYFWNEVTTNASLVKGENTIVIENLSGESWNLDCLVIKKAEAPLAFNEAGEALLEAEDGEITGTMTGTDPGDQFIGERASDNPDHATSGGKVVFCWAAAGNKVTWKFKLAEAVEYAELTLWATCAFSQSSSGLGIKVNGESKSWNEGSVNGKGNENKWYFWNKITTSTELVKGENTIVIENLSGESWNLDCLVIKKAEAPAPAPTFVNGVYRAEVEDGVLSGGASIFSQGEGEELSGGKGVGDFNGAACVTLKVVSEKERKVTADIRYALGMCNSQNQAVELHVNGTKIKGQIDNIGTDDANGWHTWEIGTSKEFVLNQGENTVELKAPFGSYTNLDYIEFKEVPLPKNFVNGVYRLEVEDGELSGCAISTQIEGEELSGGKGVGDFNFAAGSCVTLKAISDKARNVVCDIRYALGICSSQNQAVELYVNGTKIKGAIDNIGTDDANGWHTWEIGTSRTFRLNEGENTIELKAPFGSYTNLDYIELKEDNETLYFTNDACRYEAELGVLGGTAEAAVNANCSNGGCVESFSYNGGSSITFSVKVLETVTVKAVISYAMGICDSQNQAVELYVDGTKIKGQIDNIGTNDVTGWSTYVTGDSKNFELTAGTHTIVLKGPFGTYANIDYMDLVKVAA